MQSFPIRYRPKTFSEILGQKTTIKILEKQLSSNNIANCYLFVGCSGVGKTTLARILANEINNHLGFPIEIDAASHNGVDSIRAIIDEANSRATDGGEYKIFIIDECFDGDTLINTEYGYKKIKNIKVGERVASLTGFNKVTHFHSKWVENSLLNYLYLDNGEKILCTKDHLFLTTEGWIECKNLKKGDELLVYDNLFKLWQEDSHKKKGTEILLQQMSNGVEEKELTLKTIKTQDLCNLWENLCRKSSKFPHTNVFSQMSGSVNIAFSKDSKELRVWDGIKEIIFRKNVEKQPNEKPNKHQKNVSNQGPKWDSPSSFQSKGGKWFLHQTAMESLSAFERFLELKTRTPNKNKLLRIQPQQVSCSIQSRPWIRREKTGDRGGWTVSPLEKCYCKRYKENQVFRRVRVENIEIYKPTNRSGRRDRNKGYTEVFDLSVENSPTYFANNVLVHNCHAITTQGWQAFLKCIEEPPKYTIFMFCTTNPTKVPLTIQNRVQKFILTKVSNEEIKNRLKEISTKENINIDNEALEFITKVSNGCVRQAITNLETCVHYSDKLDIKTVVEALGNYAYTDFFSLTNAIIDGNEKTILELINDLYNAGKDLSLFVEQYLEFCLDLSRYCVFKSFKTLKIPESMQKELEYTTNIENNLKFFNSLVDKVLDLKFNIQHDSNIKNTVEAYLIRICRGK